MVGTLNVESQSVRHRVLVHAPLVASLALTLVVTCRLAWPLPAHVTTMHAVTDFGDGHVWVFDRICRFLTGRLPFTTVSADAGFPAQLDGRFLGWAPAVFSLPFQPWLGPLGAYNVVFLLTPTLATGAAYLFFRSATMGPRWPAAVGALLYGLCPYGLASLFNGQIEKAQIWLYPAYLWLLVRAVRGERSGWALLGIGVVSAGAVFTCPYFGLVLPLLAVPLAGWLVLRRGRHDRAWVRASIVAALALGLTAVSMAPAGRYYSTAMPGPGSVVPPSMFRPADAPAGSDGVARRFADSPSAEPGPTFLAPAAYNLHIGRSNHITYLLLPVVVFGAAALCLNGEGTGIAVGLIVLGLVIAAGPRLVMDGFYRTHAGQPYLLPMALLEHTAYPLKHGGQYYRAIAVVSLGLGLALAAGLARLSVRAGARVALASGALAATLGIGELLRFWTPMTPWPTAEVGGRAELNGLEGPGAVLALPFIGGQAVGSYGLLQATIHHRQTSAVARAVYRPDVERFAPWVGQLPAAAAAGTVPELLRGLGFRYAVLSLAYVNPERPELPELTAESLTATFGAPVQGQGILIWDLDTLKP